MHARLQSLWYNLGEGLGLGVARIFIASAILLLVFTWYAARQFAGLREPAAMEQAQLARNLATGRGAVTDCIRPADLGAMDRAGRAVTPAAGIPDVRQAPGWPALLAGGMRVLRPSFDVPPPGRLFAPETRVIVPLSLLCSLLTGLLILWIGSRLFDARVGVAACAAFAVSDGMLRASVGGGSAPLATLLTTLALGLALAAGRLRARQASPVAWMACVAGAGAAAGLAVLTAYTLWMVPLVAAGVAGAAFVRWRGAAIAVLLAVSLAVIAPWIVRNLQVSGQPFGFAPQTALQETARFPGDQWDRTETPPIDTRELVRALQVKFNRNLADFYGNRLQALGGGLVMALFLAAFFHRFEEDQAGHLKWWLALGMALTLVGAAWWRPTAETLLPWLPAVTVLAAAMLHRLLEQLLYLTNEVRTLLVAVWVLLAALPALLTLTGPAARWPYPPYAPALVRYVSDLLPDNALIATDIPAAVAWYGARAALMKPLTTDALLAMRDRGLPVGGVYLTTETGDLPYASTLLQGAEQSWLPLVNQLVPEDFPWQHGLALPPGTRDQIVLTDARHWPTNATPPPPRTSSASDGGSASGG